MLNMHNTAAIGISSLVVSGRISKATRIIEKCPSFISTPACSMLVAAGAAAWPTGDHECNGQIGAIDANPKNTRIQIILSSVVPSTGIFMRLACSRSTKISKVFSPENL